MCPGVDLRYGVDATRLHETLPHLHVSKVQHIVWNFPLAVSAELSDGPVSIRMNKLLGDDDAANRQLMAQFLAAAAGQMICYNPNMQVGASLNVALVEATDCLTCVAACCSPSASINLHTRTAQPYSTDF